jgi:trigger factor
MASTVEKKDNHVVVVTIDVPAEDFADALQRAFRKNASRFNIPGFRKGKAPMSIVTKYYGEGVLYDDAIEFAATPAYAAAIDEHGLEPVVRPEMDILEISRETGMKFTVTITVKPEVELGQYRDVEVIMPEYTVSDEDVEKELLRIQERNSRLIPVEDRAVQEGDTANIDYEGFLNEVPFEGGKSASYDLKIGSNIFIPGFEEQLIGHHAGESFDIDVTFPEDYANEELKGQAVVFKVTINEIKIRELPVLDDEFAKDVSEFDTLDEYRESLRAKQTESAQKRAEGEFKDNVVKTVVANATVDIPNVMIDQEIDRMVAEQRNQMRYQGIELEQYLEYLGQTLDAFKEQMRETAENRIRTQLVMEAISKKEEIQADPEEIEEEIERMATMYGMKAEDLRERIPVGEDDFVEESVISRKTVELLTASAVKIPQPEEQPKAKKPAKSKSTRTKKTKADNAAPPADDRQTASDDQTAE